MGGGGGICPLLPPSGYASDYKWDIPDVLLPSSFSPPSTFMYTTSAHGFLIRTYPTTRQLINHLPRSEMLFVIPRKIDWFSLDYRLLENQDLSVITLGYTRCIKRFCFTWNRPPPQKKKKKKKKKKQKERKENRVINVAIVYYT